MKQHLRIKGKYLWKLCALLVMGIAVCACYIRILTIDQPTTATVGQTITIKLTDTIQTNQSDPSSISANYVLGILLPKGWSGAQNTVVTYVSDKGNGNMSMMPASTIEPFTSGKSNLTWSNSMMARFGIGKNLVKDVEWVVFQSNQPYIISNGDKFRADATIKLTVGADKNDTQAYLAYCIAESVNGLDDSNAGNPSFHERDGGCLIVSGGSTGILHDYCHPQLTVVDPPKSTSNEFITISFNSKLVANSLSGASSVYLCVDTAYTSDGKALTGFCAQTEKTSFVQTSTGSGMFSLTLWPKSFFNLSGSQTLTKMIYHITDKTGATRVGYGGDPNVPFTYLFGCN